MADAQAEGNPEIASGGDEGVVMIRWGGYRCPPSPAVPVAALEVRRGLAWWGWKWSGWLLERPWATPEPQGWGVIADHRHVNPSESVTRYVLLHKKAAALKMNRILKQGKWMNSFAGPPAARYEGEAQDPKIPNPPP